MTEFSSIRVFGFTATVDALLYGIGSPEQLVDFAHNARQQGLKIVKIRNRKVSVFTEALIQIKYEVVEE